LLEKLNKGLEQIDKRSSTEMRERSKDTDEENKTFNGLANSKNNSVERQKKGSRIETIKVNNNHLKQIHKAPIGPKDIK
jgi:hypothetical protein